MSAASIEDVLAGALWVNGLTDPTLSLDRLHSTFLDVIFSFPGEEVADQSGATREPGRLRTAAEVERERRNREHLRQAADDLLGIGTGAGSYADEGADELSAEDEEEDELDVNEQFMEDQAFLDWVDHTQHVTRQREDREQVKGSSSAVELELLRVGLGKEEESKAADALPDRLKEIETRERRPRLGAKSLPGGYAYSISLESEAYWVLRQLRNTGQPLAHNTRVCALANRPWSEIADEPILGAIAFALRKMTREFLEPSHLMVYHQTELHPLLFALLDGSPLLASAEQSVPVSSLAYSALTGRRQRPTLSETFVGFPLTSTASIGDGDKAWRDLFGHDYTVRKPCLVELGRLLVRILELDSLCHKLECRRQQMLIMLRDSTEARVQDQRTLLEHTVFEDAAEADLWHSFVQSLSSARGRDAYHVVRTLGLEEAYEEYTITALQYQENFLSNSSIHQCSNQPHMSLHAWAEQVGSVLTPTRSSEWILALFNNAIVESFARLPSLCKQVLDLFCSEGDLIVSYTAVQRKDDIFPLASFFVDHPRHYVNLLQKERQGLVRLFYVVDENLIRRVLNARQLYHSAPLEEMDSHSPSMEWYREREAAMELLVYRLVDKLTAKVKSELLNQAAYQLDVTSVRRLGLLCSQGPYEPTKLTLEAYTASSLTWEPEWNVVEALPTDGGAITGGTVNTQSVPSRLRARVCAVFQSENGVTSFAFIDEHGAVLGTTRWMECAMNSALGRAAALMQNISLEKMFVQCTPSVIAVAASGTSSFRLMRSIQEFVHDRVVPALGVSVDVVWAAPEIARFSSETSFADQETPSMDHAMRTSVALARMVQDPVNVIATLFDAKRTIVRALFTSAAGNASRRESEETFFRRVSWEMSLWVAGTGFWLEDCVRRPNSIATMQFAPGLGRWTARLLWQHVSKTPTVSRAGLATVLNNLFGEYVARNALSAVRLGIPDVNDEQVSTWHPLDQTLIPPTWYGVAEGLISAVLKKASRTGGLVDDAAAKQEEESIQLPASPVFVFFTKNIQERRELVSTAAAKSDLLREMQEYMRPTGIELVSGRSEYNFILDELIAGGCSSLRRPYRRLSTRELMLGVTGVTFIAMSELRDIIQRGLVSSSAFTSDAASGLAQEDGDALLSLAAADSVTDTTAGSVVIKEGDYVTGTVSGVRGGRNAGVRLVTSRGLDAFISIEGITDSALRNELDQHIQYLESMREARKAGSPISDATADSYVAPAWLRRGALTQGIAVRCNWSRCELHLVWCPQREVSFGASKGEDNNVFVPPPYASLVGYSVAGVGDEATSYNHLGDGGAKGPRAFATKISRHVLFRDFNNSRAQEELRDKEIGEMLLRPATGMRNGAICVVKLGVNCTASWNIREERKSNGSIYYVLREKLINKTFAFDEIDELLRDYMGGVIALVRSMRRHRRFVERLRDVRGALDDQQRAGSGNSTFAYCFAETGTMSKPPPLYRVFTSCGNRQYAFRLHFTNTAIYVRLPLGKSTSGTDKVDYRWLECSNAEQVSETVKNHARKSNSFF